LNSRAIVQLLCCAALFVGTSAQTPPPAPVLPDKPLRHMEFAYSVDYQHLGEQHQGDIGTGKSGVVSTAGGSGRQGTLIADVMGVAKDGGLVIRTQEWLQSTPRASQAFLCAVYPEGRVVCPEHLDVTDAENEIMTYLGRGFLDPSIIDEKGQWVRQFSNKYVAVASQFIVVGNPDANPLAIDAKTTITSVGGESSNYDDTAHLTYDRMLDVPVTLHDVAVEHARGSQSTQTTMDFKLTKDSLAPPKP
jgi:hypothetical protein